MGRLLTNATIFVITFSFSVSCDFILLNNVRNAFVSARVKISYLGQIAYESPEKNDAIIQFTAEDVTFVPLKKQKRS